MKRIIATVCLAILVLPLWGQADRSDVRAGNRKFRKGKIAEAELSYRKALVKDSTSFAATYNLASALYRQQDFENAGKTLERLSEAAQASGYADRYYFNSGDAALQRKDYAAALEAFKQSLLDNPADIDAKESYIYAKEMLKNQQNQQNQQDQQNDQNDDQDQQDNQNQQNQDNQQDNRQQDNQQDRQNEPKISPKQAQQILKAIQAKERETQDKVNREKADMNNSRQKEKDW